MKLCFCVRFTLVPLDHAHTHTYMHLQPTLLLPHRSKPLLCTAGSSANTMWQHQLWQAVQCGVGSTDAGNVNFHMEQHVNWRDGKPSPLQLCMCICVECAWQQKSKNWATANCSVALRRAKGRRAPHCQTWARAYARDSSGRTEWNVVACNAKTCNQQLWCQQQQVASDRVDFLHVGFWGDEIGHNAKTCSVHSVAGSTTFEQAWRHNAIWEWVEWARRMSGAPERKTKWLRCYCRALLGILYSRAHMVMYASSKYATCVRANIDANFMSELLDF